MHDKTLVTIPIIILILGLVAIGIIIEPSFNNNFRGLSTNNIEFITQDLFTNTTMGLNLSNNKLLITLNKTKTYFYNKAYYINENDEWQLFNLTNVSSQTGTWTSHWVKEEAIGELPLTDTSIIFFSCELFDISDVDNLGLTTVAKNNFIDKFEGKYQYFCGLKSVTSTEIEKNYWQIKPISCTEETCDGIDNDCDGEIDEGLTSTDNCLQSGVCADSYKSCNNGVWGGCDYPTTYSSEICDGLDNDCDGSVDEGVKTIYYRDADLDNYGDPSITTLACSPPAGYQDDNLDCLDSNANVNPGNLESGATECWNSLNDDCDSGVDYDGFHQGTLSYSKGDNSCPVGVQNVVAPATIPRAQNFNLYCKAVNNAGTTISNLRSVEYSIESGSCTGGSWVSYNSDTYVQFSCNFNSVGTFNVGCTVNNAESYVISGKSSTTTSVVVTDTSCSGSPSTQSCGECGTMTQVCNDGSWTYTGASCTRDTQNCYTGTAGTEGVGDCHAGNQTCTSGTWGSCVGEVIDSSEICDNIDNDCDGIIDEDCTTEICNGIDDNLDGNIDENTCNEQYYCDEDNDFVFSEIPIVCGDYACVSEYSDTTQHNCQTTIGDDCDDTNANINSNANEVCDDNIDNDCDGLIDYNDPDCNSEVCILNCVQDNDCNYACDENNASGGVCNLDPDCCISNDDCSGVCDTTTHQCVNCPTNLANGAECISSCNSCSDGLGCYENSWSSTGYFCQDPDCNSNSDISDSSCVNNVALICEQNADPGYYYWRSMNCGSKTCTMVNGYATCTCEIGSCSGLNEECVFGSTGDTYLCSNGCWEKTDTCTEDETCVESMSGGRTVADCVTSCVPSTEICNGIDDDCDGNIDDGATCDSGYECQSGECVQTCTDDVGCSASNEHENECQGARLKVCEYDGSCYHWVEGEDAQYPYPFNFFGCLDDNPMYHKFYYASLTENNMIKIYSTDKFVNNLNYCENYNIATTTYSETKHYDYEGNLIEGTANTDPNCNTCVSDDCVVGDLLCDGSDLKQCITVTNNCNKWVNTKQLLNGNSCENNEEVGYKSCNGVAYVCVKLEEESTYRWRFFNDVVDSPVACTDFKYPYDDLWGHFKADISSTDPSQRYVLNEWAYQNSTCNTIRSDLDLTEHGLS